MPYTIETQDGITIENIPDDIKPDDQRLKDRVAQIRAERNAGGPISGEKQRAQQQASPQPQQGTDWLGLLGHNLGVASRGAIQGAGSLVTVPADFLTALTNVAKNGWNAPAVQLPSEALADTLTQVGVPQAQGTAEQILQATSGALAGTGTTIQAGKALVQTGRELVPNVTQLTGQALASQPTQQAAGAVGSALGAEGAQQLAQNAGADEGQQQAAGVVGSLVGGATAAGATGAGQRIWNAVTGNKGVAMTPQENMVQTAAGKPLMTSDVFPPRGGAGQVYQTLSERNPFLGTGPLRAGQQEARVNAVRDLLADYGASTDSAVFNSASDATMADLANLRRSELGKYTGMKNEVIDRLSQPISQPNMTDFATGKPSAPVKIPVPVPKATAAIDAEIAKLQSLKTQEVSPIIAKLQDFKTAIQGQDLRNIETLRAQLGQSFKSSDLASVKTTGEKSINSIYAPLREDMGDYIKANGKPDDFRDWSVANKQLSDMQEGNKKNILANTLRKGDATPEVVQRMLFSTRPSDVQALYKNLTPTGQANARIAILSKAAQNALSAGTEEISPEKFATQVQKLGGPIGVFFSSEDKAQIEGLTKYLNMTRRAAESTRNPSTGVQNVIPGLGVGATGFTTSSLFGGNGWEGLAATVGGGTALGAMSRVYESAPVRNALIALAKAKPGSAEEATLAKRVMQATQANYSLMQPNQPTQQTQSNQQTQSASDMARAYQRQKAGK